MKIISDLFESSPQAILAYVCSNENQQERNRQIIFTSWFNSYPYKDQFIFLKEIRESTYCGLIVKKEYYTDSEVNKWFNNFSFEK